MDGSNPALNVLQRLCTATEQLGLQVHTQHSLLNISQLKFDEYFTHCDADLMLCGACFKGGWWNGVPGGNLQYCLRIRCVVVWDPAQWAREAALALPDFQHRQGLAQSWFTAKEISPCFLRLSGEPLNVIYCFVFPKTCRNYAFVVTSYLIDFSLWLKGSWNGAPYSVGPYREWSVFSSGAQDEQLLKPNGAVPSQSAWLSQWQWKRKQVCGNAIFTQIKPM